MQLTLYTITLTGILGAYNISCLQMSQHVIEYYIKNDNLVEIILTYVYYLESWKVKFKLKKIITLALRRTPLVRFINFFKKKPSRSLLS